MKTTIIELVCIKLAILMLLICSVYVYNMDIHHCDWEDCNYVGQRVTVDNFQSTWGYEDGTDGFYTELTHIANPDMTYEECEDYVFSGVE